MLQLIKKGWSSISNLGIDNKETLPYDELKRRIFFNRSIFIGFFAMVGMVGNTSSFIGNYSYINLIGASSIPISFYLTSKGHFNIAKRLVVYSIYSGGIFLTAVSGKDYLYHFGTTTMLAFSWVIFDLKKERIELLFIAAMTFSVHLIAELNLFNAPDFTQHPDTLGARISNIFMITIFILVFINFIRSLNIEYEKRLKNTIAEKEKLLAEITNKSKEIEQERGDLEKIVSERTAELLKQKEELEEQNNDKEVLLKEIHHRVKNNLQIIVSLLNLQADKFKDDNYIKALKETQNRVISMSLVHQKMSQTSNFDEIEMNDYIDRLFENNKSLYMPHNENITFKNDSLLNISLSIDTAIPFGLVVNEMLSNSFKHAFKEIDQIHEVVVNISQLDEGKIKFLYSDNGAGFPESFDINTSGSLGVEIMLALADQIDGEIKYFNDNGATYELVFSL